MLSYSEIKPKMIIDLDGEPYHVLSAGVVKKQRQKPVNKTKLKHLISGTVVEHTFQQSDNVEEADIEKEDVRYLYTKENRQTNTTEYWFADPDDPSDRFMLTKDVIGETELFLKQDEIVEALRYDGTVVSISVPIKMELSVQDAPPNVKGNTAQGGTKQVTLETGAVITTPMFVETGDVVEVNTETGEYVRRVN